MDNKEQMCYNECNTILNEIGMQNHPGVDKGFAHMTIADIARLAGVSNAAVSRYFNNGYISEEKREAIRKVIEETGYRPSASAAQLRTKKTKTIGVIAPKLASSSLGSMMEGILNVLNENGYQMLISITQNDSEKELSYLQTFDERTVDGVILMATVYTAEHKRMLKNMKVPVIILGQRFPGQYCVFHDDYNGMFDLTRMILEKGRTKLGYIGVMRQDKAAGAQRQRGFLDAMEEDGYSVSEDHCLIAKFNVHSGYEKAAEMLKRYPDMDGLICATDEIAIGAMQYLLEHGKAVPEDIYIAGLGDSVMARVAGHSIATVHYSYEKSGEVAANMLMEIITTGETSYKEVMLGYYLVDNLTYGVKEKKE